MMKQCTGYHADILDPKRQGVELWMTLEKGEWRDWSCGSE